LYGFFVIHYMNKEKLMIEIDIYQTIQRFKKMENTIVNREIIKREMDIVLYSHCNNNSIYNFLNKCDIENNPIDSESIKLDIYIESQRGLGITLLEKFIV
jgi:hypothetical protein